MIFIGAPRKIVIEIFYHYNINLEDNNSLDFEDLLKKTLVIVRYGKFLANLVHDGETELTYKYIEPQKKIPVIPNNVELLMYLV